METSIIMMNVELGKEKEVIAELKKIPEIKKIYMTYGVYDLIVILETEDLDKMKEIVSWNIRRMKNVQATLTLVAEETA